VLRSYSKKAERRHDTTGQRHDGDANAGQVVPVHGNGGQVGAWHGGQARGFSESSSYETREHYERKVQRSVVKKTRGERERSRNRGNKVDIFSFSPLFENGPHLKLSEALA